MGVGEEEVLGLEVAVANAAVVAVPDSGQELPEVVPSGAFVRAAVHLRRRGARVCVVCCKRMRLARGAGVCCKRERLVRGVGRVACCKTVTLGQGTGVWAMWFVEKESDS